MQQKNSLKNVPGSQITNPALHWIAKQRIKQWNVHAKDPQSYQIKTLLSHCKRAQQTEFGAAHHFKSIQSYTDFKAQVPLRTYADFEPWIQKMRKGATNVLWPGLIPFFGQSSGSSSTAAQHKFLPISWEQIRWQQKAGFDLLARYLDISKDPSFTQGFSLGLFPPSILKPESPGVSVGSNPGIMLRHIPRPGSWLTIPHPPVRDIEDYDQKLTAIAESYMHYNVTSMSGTTCWFSVFFDRLLSVAKKRGLKAQKVSDIWPHLSVLFGGGVHAQPYLKIIEEKVGRKICLIDNYNATEGGILAATDTLNQPGMLILPDRGIFFEFVPRVDHGKANARRLALWEVEPDMDYSVALTTSSGLFGYLIGDFVRFSSVNPHRMEFAGRASGVLSLTQELTSFLEIERSFAVACERHPCTIVEYSASAEVGVNSLGKGRYVFFVEFQKPPKDLESFTQAVDQALKSENRVYREHRINDVAILPPKTVILKQGATKDFMKALGYSSVQNKFPRIISDMKKKELLQTLAFGE